MLERRWISTGKFKTDEESYLACVPEPLIDDMIEETLELCHTSLTTRVSRGRWTVDTCRKHYYNWPGMVNESRTFSFPRRPAFPVPRLNLSKHICRQAGST